MRVRIYITKLNLKKTCLRALGVGLCLHWHVKRYYSISCV